MLHSKILNQKTLCLVENIHLERHKVLTCMNYQKIHDQIIERAKSRQLDGYKERHHIIPQCLGGTNIKNNLVDLTAREHFIVHKILCEIYPDNDKIFFAYRMMALAQNKLQLREHNISSREYQYLREQFSERMRKLSPTSRPEVRRKMSESLTGRSFTEEHKKNIGIANGGENCTADTRKKLRFNRLDKPHSQQAIEKIRYAALHREKIKCPHCDKEGNGGNMNRWHFDNCKHNNLEK